VEEYEPMGKWCVFKYWLFVMSELYKVLNRILSVLIPGDFANLFHMFQFWSKIDKT
jgi:hypothetical protein